MPRTLGAATHELRAAHLEHGDLNWLAWNLRERLKMASGAQRLVAAACAIAASVAVTVLAGRRAADSAIALTGCCDESICSKCALEVRGSMAKSGERGTFTCPVCARASPLFDTRLGVTPYSRAGGGVGACASRTRRHFKSRHFSPRNMLLRPSTSILARKRPLLPWAWPSIIDAKMRE